MASAFFVSVLSSSVAGIVIALGIILIDHGYYGMMLAIPYACMFLPFFWLVSRRSVESFSGIRHLVVSALVPALLVGLVYLFDDSETEFFVIFLFGLAGFCGGLVPVVLRATPARRFVWATR